MGTRTYPYPKELFGKVVKILQSAEGTAGKSAVPDKVPENAKTLQYAGEVVVRDCIVYHTRKSWDKHEHYHLVPKDNKYGWTEAKVYYGWVLGPKPVNFEKPQPVKKMVRVKRSVFKIEE